jgi:nucleoside-diphosphate-sugar epimerase
MPCDPERTHAALFMNERTNERTHPPKISRPDSADGTFPEPANAHAYRWSKTAAERAVWDYIAGPTAAFSVTTILPPMVLGRNMQALSAPRDLNQSSLIVSPGNYTCDEIKITTLFHIIAWKF